ncbi:hypothetical protein C4D60_Mb05t21710 [Musa balbisiana]|uniref:Uncharacterized protein n=1 Tax=Musa balbisiana TaxID=52838 RepID=A0A4S8JXV8_MUSBA|nr:hypothetical protein C4D60_Mb05t21710 [Musa balbisiana]
MADMWVSKSCVWTGWRAGKCMAKGPLDLLLGSKADCISSTLPSSSTSRSESYPVMLKNIQITQFRGGASHFILFYVFIRRAYDVVVQFFITFVSNLSYLCLSVFGEKVGVGGLYGLAQLFFLFTLHLHDVVLHEGGSERVSFGIAGDTLVSDVVAFVLDLVSNIRELLSSSLTWKRLHAYNALLGSSRLVLLLVVASTTMPPLTIDRCPNFFNLNYTKVAVQRTVAIDKPVDTSLGVHLTLIYGLPTPRFTAIPVPTKLQMTRARR